jgi:hypothetical protein
MPRSTLNFADSPPPLPVYPHLLQGVKHGDSTLNPPFYPRRPQGVKYGDSTLNPQFRLPDTPFLPAAGASALPRVTQSNPER